jgi:hypothetical protein
MVSLRVPPRRASFKIDVISRINAVKEVSELSNDVAQSERSMFSETRREWNLNHEEWQRDRSRQKHL